jgi:CoA:oxalate CoA-transferase
MSLPLKGVRVLDLTAVISGPLCSYQLAMLGADVIKIEVPDTGDIARRLGADLEMNKDLMGVSFWALNAGKKSVTLNLKHERGRIIFRELLKDAHVVVENYRPGAMKKLGLDYAALKEVNPSIIYCAMTGFGQDGPLSARPSYDQIIQGLSGIMSVTGDEKTAPLRSGYVVCDTMASMVAAFAISSALYRQQKTGKGEMIDVAMLDSTLSTMPAWLVSNYLNAGKTPKPMGNHNHASSPSGAFRTGEGLLNIVCNDQKQFENLCDVIGRSELKSDRRFLDRPLRMVHTDELKNALEEALQAKSAQEWDRLLNAAHVPAGVILTLPEILSHPQIESRQLIKRFKQVKGLGRDIAVTRLGFRLSGEQPDTDVPPPRLGQDTEEVLSGLGYSAGDVAELRQLGVV